jgi:hypothetical protein
MDKRLKTKRIELTMAEHLVCAFINADNSGLEPDDIQAIEKAIEDYGPCFHVYMPDNMETDFTWCDLTGLMSECLTCLVEISA